MTRLGAYLRTPASYATTIVYLCGVGLLAATAEGWVPVGFAIIGLTLITALAMVIAAMREVHKVIDLVNCALLERMDELLVALDEADRRHR